MMQILDGKLVAKAIKEEIKAEVQNLLDQHKRVPHLATVLVGNDPASETYVNSKIKACETVGFKSTCIKLDSSISEAELLLKIDALNEDDSLDGFIVQLPLPKHINEQKIIERVNPNKDVDGFHPVNMGKLALGFPALKPATPAGILELLKYYNIETKGKHCVVLGRSNIVGSPLSIMMRQKTYPGNCTVTICHSQTKNMEEYTRTADILMVAIGSREFVTKDMVKPGAVVIDVGIHRIPSNNVKGYELRGDVQFGEVSSICSYISPVPGGVGPLTIASLLKNTLLAYHLKNQNA